MLPVKCLCKGPFCHLPSPHGYIQPGFNISSLTALCLGSVWSQQQQVVFQLRPCQKDRTARFLPCLQGPTCPAFPSGVHSSFMPSHIPPIETSLFPPCYLQDATRCSQLYSPQSHLTSSEDQALLLAQQSLRTGSFSPPTKNAIGSSTPALPFLLPAGEWGPGRGCRDHKHWCISGQRCCCCLLTVDASLVLVVCTKFHLVVTLRMGFSTKPVAESANVLFLTSAFLAHSTSLPGCLRGPAKPGQCDLKVSYMRNSPPVSCCGCPSNHCLKPSSTGMLARSHMMDKFLVR